MSAVLTNHPQPDPKHVANFAAIEPWLFRGDQPDDEGYRWLVARGVRVIVNLRKRNTKKRAHRAAPGIDYKHIPVTNDHAPRRRQAIEFLTLCQNCRPERPIYVHCRGGKGRTSTFCALVRLAQGWPAAKLSPNNSRSASSPPAGTSAKRLSSRSSSLRHKPDGWLFRKFKLGG